MSEPQTCLYCSHTFHWGVDEDSAIVEAQGNNWKTCRENAFWKLTFHMQLAHPDNLTGCPRRHESFDTPHFSHKDYWGVRKGKSCCSYCGSLSPEDFLKACEEGVELGPTDKSYKVYVHGVGSGKFYFQHLSINQRRQFIDLLNAKKLKIGIPGYFYSTPFFITYKRPQQEAGV